ncbi:hypothetical protein MQK76_17855 [Vibrio cholerae]|nr:hypothetical protein [Vibrio cholerae]EJE4200788.1 hypothetical protein [Vibrio cholerae]EJL6849045.1 hypothetical protein [Vibrio cholerae]EJL7002189.1 hypothetical protein [Vibrio cholerae]EJM7234004.1 hypothetical protein [Vibrio cholerae]
MEWFEKYQTFLAGLIGFVGVVVTILANGYLYRKQFLKEKSQESSALRRTLIEELRLISETYTINMQRLSEDNDYPIAYIPSTPHIEAFKQLVPKFGLLTGDEIKKTMLAYQLIQELPDKLRLFQIIDSSVHKEGFVAIEKAARPSIVDVYDHTFSPVLQAIEILNSFEKTS